MTTEKVKYIRFKQFMAGQHPDLVTSAYLYDVWLVDNLEHPIVQREECISKCEAVNGMLELAVKSVPYVHKLLCIGNPKRVLALQNGAAPQFHQGGVLIILIQLVHIYPTIW